MKDVVFFVPPVPTVLSNNQVLIIPKDTPSPTPSHQGRGNARSTPTRGGELFVMPRSSSPLTRSASASAACVPRVGEACPPREG